jgi:hypothetical protein
VTNVPRALTRFVLFTAAPGEGVDALLDPYAPSVFCRANDGSGSFTDGTAREWSALPDGELPDAVLALAAEHSGRTIAIAASADAIRGALGVPPSAAERFVVADAAVSVIELDSELRWAVVRLNEGRALPGDA